MIDDDADHLLICRIGLEKAGFDVYPVQRISSLDLLLDQIRELSPDLIFVDHEMPAYKGDQVIARLRSEDVTAQLPIIYFSGNDDLPELAQKCGADGYIRKPFEMRELINTATGFLEKGSDSTERATA